MRNSVQTVDTYSSHGNRPNLINVRTFSEALLQQHRAATAIQTSFRGFTARKRYIKLLEEREAEAEAREARAALLAQEQWSKVHGATPSGSTAAPDDGYIAVDGVDPADVAHKAEVTVPTATSQGQVQTTKHFLC